MKQRRKTILEGIVIGVVIASVISAFSIYMLGEASAYVLIRGLGWFAGKDTQQRQVRLLCETDHQALLEACNELSRQAKRGELKPGRYNVRRDRDPQASGFPQPIRALSPSYVYIDENDSGRVMLEMLGGLGHFGVQAYTEDYKKPPVAGFTFGDRELIPRLWYYDDGYIGHPEYDRRIERLIQEGTAKQKETTADR